MKLITHLTLLLFEITLCYSMTGDQELLDRRLLYYEPLHYDKDELHLLHRQVDKSGEVLRYRFHAFKRYFSLELRRMRQSKQNIIVHHKKKTTRPDMSFIYTGTDTESSGSEAKLAVINGTLQGTILLPGETTYHIAPSHWFFQQPTPFHTIIYSEEDYIWNHTYHSDTTNYARDLSKNLYKKSRGIHKRVIPPPSSGQDNHVCTVKLTTDKTVWKYFMDMNQNEDKSPYDILFMLINHVAEANKVFKNSEFTLNQGLSTEEKFKGIQFEIRKIKIMTDNDCEDNDKSVLCNDDLGDLGGDEGEELLNKFADEEEQEDISDNDFYYNDYQNDEFHGDNEYKDYEYPTTEAKYCLSFLITARVLTINNESPLLGLAFHASKDKDGGICSNQNKGFITLFQETRQALPPLVTQLVFAHEVAHAFGALHDSMEECADFNLKEEPADGYYLMHNVAQRGDKPNHHKLSACSLKYISQILSRKESRMCFTDSALPYCGNGIVDDEEECDCGDDCYTGKDNCCHSFNATGGLRCKLKVGAQCSTSQGPCCDSRTCQFINQSENIVCQNSKPCVDEIYCHGDMHGYKCPPPRTDRIKEDGFICSTNGRFCDAGNCNASICQLIQWEECQMANDNENLTNQEKEELCYIGCRRRRSDECISSHDINQIKQHPEFMTLLSNISSDTKILPIHLPLGAPCNKETGYCDKFKRCQFASVDPKATSLRNCARGTVCKGHVVFLLQHYWWIMLLAGLICIYLSWKIYMYRSAHMKSYNLETLRGHPNESYLMYDSSVEDCENHHNNNKKKKKKSLFLSIKSVKSVFERTCKESVCREYKFNTNFDELEVLNDNPLPEVQAANV